jgi:hypothetical protein
LEEFIENSIKEVITTLEGGYTVLLESDIAGLLFHALINRDEVNINQVHLNTRITQPTDDKIDLVIGEIDKYSFKKPSIEPEYLFELKCIPTVGFTERQMKTRVKQIYTDILKVASYKLTEPRFIVIHDGTNFFESKMKKFIDYRDVQDEGIVIIRIFKKNDNWHYEAI